MTALADVALAFARECLGWSSAAIVTTVASRNLIADGIGASFDYTDLNAVMEAVRGWCEANRLDCTLRYVCISELFEARLVGDGLNGTMSREHAQSLRTEPCHALLAACVEAARKLKAS